MAAVSVCKWKNDTHSRKKGSAGGTREQEQDLLEEPFAQAVMQMGYGQGDVLQAIRSLRKNSKTVITAEKLMQQLMTLESKGATSGASPGDSLTLSYSSDGESDHSSMECEEGDLQTDGAAGEVCVTAAAAAAEAEPAGKKASPGHSGKQREDLRKMLMALREENRRLKARQMCRECGTRPVSITFLPCGHFSFCYECGQGFQACPLCCKTILADVRTFLA